MINEKCRHKYNHLHFKKVASPFMIAIHGKKVIHSSLSLRKSNIWLGYYDFQ